MLVLTRKLQEKIRIADNITITIVRIQGSTVRVGIEAPQDVRILRGEVSAMEPTVAQDVDMPASLGSNESGSEPCVRDDIADHRTSRTLAGRVRRRAGDRKNRRADIAALNAI